MIDTDSNKNCPRCGKKLLAVTGKNGKLLGHARTGNAVTKKQFQEIQMPVVLNAISVWKCW